MFHTYWSFYYLYLYPQVLPTLPRLRLDPHRIIAASCLLATWQVGVSKPYFPTYLYTLYMS